MNTPKPIKILLIEDSEGDARLLKETLSEVDSIEFSVIHTERLSSGLQLLHENCFDVVLLDLGLPDAQGLSALNEVHRERPEVPVVILTGYNDESGGIAAVQQGAQDYLIKCEITKEILAKAIIYALERNRLLTEVEEARRLERHNAYHDPLTGLANRQLFYDRLKQAVAQGNRYIRKLGVLFIDLDGFKHVNDTFGHSAGDQLLQNVANRLRKNIRESDSVARIGGDEFTIVLDHIIYNHDAAKVAQKLLRLLSMPYVIEGQEINISASIGISLYPFDGQDIETLVKKADIAMYRSKRLGKNQFQLYNDSVDQAIFENLTLESGLQSAIERNELVLHYQPQLNLGSGEIVGVEALVRWQHPQFGLIYPAKFIPMAEETGLIGALGEWVLRTACEQIKSWQNEILPDIRLAINVSIRQFHGGQLPETVALVLEETNLDPASLQLEITESNAMQHLENTVVALEKFKQLGVQLSFDDFGTGYTAFGYLKRFPLDILKIDQSFVQGIPVDRSDTAIITAIIVLAHTMGLKVIAEGVETEEQLHYLKSLQCDEMQGYYFSQPLSVDQLSDLLHTDTRLLSDVVYT